MKKVFIIALVSVASSLFSQTGKVGINTPTPSATLDIQPNTANAATTATTAEGLLIPRVSRLRAANMGLTPAVSTMIYINSVADGSAAGTTANVDAVGFYYFDGAVWIKLNPGGGGAAIEPLNQMGTASTKSSTNTTNSYLNAKLGVGDFSGTTGLAAMPATEKFRIINGDQSYIAEGNNFSDAYYYHYSNEVGNRGSIVFNRARGTAAAPVAVQTGDQLGSIYYESQAINHMYVDVIRGATAGVATMQYKTGTGTNILTVNSDASRAVTTTGAFYNKTTAITATTYTVAADDHLIVTGAGALTTITLPPVATSTGRMLVIVNGNTAASSVVVNPSGTDVTLGTFSILQYRGKHFFCDGTRWIAVSYN